MDQPTVDQILAMLERVQAEYDAELAKFGPEDPFEKHQHKIKSATRHRIETEIIVMSGRLPEGATF